MQRKVTYTCETVCYFEYLWYPFDTQSCSINRMVTYKNFQLKAGVITYTGPNEIGRYHFRNINYCEVNKNGEQGLFIDLIFSRPLTGNLMTIFLPTAMLLLISQMSTKFSSTFLEVVIEVNTTILLVLITM